MRRYPLALLLASAVIAAAQPASPSPTEPPANPPATQRAVSSAMAGTLKSALPKSAFVKPPEKTPAAESADLRETDKPRNEIVRLPKYLVIDKKPPVFREQDIYTREAFARRLAKRYYSEGYLAFDRLFHLIPFSSLLMDSAGGYAMAKFREEERLRLMREFADYANMMKTSDRAMGARVKDLTQEMFMHKTDFGWQGGAPR